MLCVVLEGCPCFSFGAGLPDPPILGKRQPEFGAYRGLAGVLRPQALKTAERRRKTWKRPLLSSAPNSSARQNPGAKDI